MTTVIDDEVGRKGRLRPVITYRLAPIIALLSLSVTLAAHLLLVHRTWAFALILLVATVFPCLAALIAASVAEGSLRLALSMPASGLTLGTLAGLWCEFVTSPDPVMDERGLFMAVFATIGFFLGTSAGFLMSAMIFVRRLVSRMN